MDASSELAPAHAFLGTALWGLHMGFTQRLLSKLVADTAPASLRGTAFGVFNLVSGVALLLASVIAGALWSAIGPAGTFVAGALFALLAMVGLGVSGGNRVAGFELRTKACLMVLASCDFQELEISRAACGLRAPERTTI